MCILPHTIHVQVQQATAICVQSVLIMIGLKHLTFASVTSVRK